MLSKTMLGSLAAVLLTPTLLVGTAAPARATRQWDWGRISADDGVLRKGCHSYTYRYDLHPPDGDWALETFIVDPRGETIASGAHLVDHDPLKGSSRFRICRAVTKPGRFLVRGKLSVQDGPDQYVEGWIKPTLFRLRRP